MLPPPRIYPGRPYSATEANAATRYARAGQISPGPGLRGMRSANGSTLSVVKEPKKRTFVTVGGAVVVTELITYTDTVVDVPLEPPLSTEILGVPTDGKTAAGGMMDLDADTAFITLNVPGSYLIPYSVTCSYSEACAQPLNLSDCETRVRLRIGGELRDETAIFGTHHSKLCATDLIYGVGGEIGSGLSADGGGSGSGTGAVTGTLDVPVEKVLAYNRWAAGRLTISGTFQVVVVLDAEGNPKIATGLPAAEGDTPTLSAPTIGLAVDRSAIEPDPGLEPLEWFPAASTSLALHSAQIHIIKLS